MTDLKNTLFIFTTSPAGLGHIRVMDAIKEGRPTGITSIDIGITDIRANRIHDVGSRIKAFVKLTEFYQTNPIAERIVTAIYTQYLRRHTARITDRFTQIAKDYPLQKKWVVISTHFALAHSISAAKEILEKNLGIKIYLCVVVTDDSPQRVWRVVNSDITFVASIETRSKLASFFPKAKQDSVKVISFPISERLIQNLTLQEFQFIVDQLNPTKSTGTQIEIPISGAAVQLDFFSKFIENLCRENFEFTVIGQKSILTDNFFDGIRKLPRVQVSIGADSWQTVNFYESVFYQPKRPAIEITKPSEQAFKAILTPRQRGGVILLLTEAIGRQEYDNLEYLRRNGLMPNREQQKALFFENDLAKWVEIAKTWRAIQIPNDPIKAAGFVRKLKASGIFYAMLSFTSKMNPGLSMNGVSEIWSEIEKMIN